MSDVVEDLQHAMKADREPWDDTLYQRALDEILRLREQCSKLAVELSVAALWPGGVPVRD